MCACMFVPPCTAAGCVCVLICACLCVCVYVHCSLYLGAQQLGLDEALQLLLQLLLGQLGADLELREAERVRVVEVQQHAHVERCYRHEVRLLQVRQPQLGCRRKQTSVRGGNTRTSEAETHTKRWRKHTNRWRKRANVTRGTILVKQVSGGKGGGGGATSTSQKHRLEPLTLDRRNIFSAFSFLCTHTHTHTQTHTRNTYAHNLKHTHTPETNTHTHRCRDCGAR